MHQKKKTKLEKKTKPELIGEIQQLRKRVKILERIIMFNGHELKHSSIEIYAHAWALFRSYKNPENPKAAKAYRISFLLRRQEQLIEDLLTYLLTSKPKLKVEEFQFKEIVDSIKELYYQKFSGGVQLIADDSVLNATIVANKLGFLSIVLNLTRNAFRHGGENMTRIKYSYRKTRKFHVVSVSNNGDPVKEEDCENIFNMFERGDSVSRDKVGLGVGLASVKAFCKQHGGDACCKPGKRRGVTFDIKISRSL